MDYLMLDLVLEGDDRRWHLKQDGVAMASFATRADGVRLARAYAEQLLDGGREARLVVRGEDGRLAFECHYRRRVWH